MPDILMLCSKSEQQKAERILKRRIANGESAEDILDVHDKYYLDKLVKGLVRYTDIIYRRIICVKLEG